MQKWLPPPLGEKSECPRLPAHFLPPSCPPPPCPSMGGGEKRLLISSLRHSKEKERGGGDGRRKGGRAPLCFVLFRKGPRSDGVEEWAEEERVGGGGGKLFGGSEPRYRVNKEAKRGKDGCIKGGNLLQNDASSSSQQIRRRRKRGYKELFRGEINSLPSSRLQTFLWRPRANPL